MLFSPFRHVPGRCRRGFTTQTGTRGWKSVIGLEIHAQLSTNSKLFSPAPAVFGAPTNSSVDLFDAAIPGTLPCLNKKAVELAVLSALAFGCKINPISYFDRKHYFYSDLPGGYQITQQRLPVAENGKVEYAVYQPGIHKKPLYKTSYIKQIQLEQDSGKSLYEDVKKQCYVDLNRAGNPLIEIVFQPDVEDENDAVALVKEVIRILGRVGSCSCKMEEGALRIDANVSLHQEGTDLGVRTEIKNLGSVSAVHKAVGYEIIRQMKILDKGETVQNETLAWDAANNIVKPLRKKEESEDYRFMPEPNLPPLRLMVDDFSEGIHKNSKSKNVILNISHLKKKVPRSPQDDRMMLMEKYSLDEVNAFNLVNHSKLLRYFLDVMNENQTRDSRMVYLFLINQLLHALKSNFKELENCTIPSKHLGEIVDLLQKRRISRNTSDRVLDHLVKTDDFAQSISEYIGKNNLFIISNPKELRKVCLKILEKEQGLVVSYKKKKRKSIFNFLINKVIEESKFRADTSLLPKIMSDLLDDVEEEH